MRSRMRYVWYLACLGVQIRRIKSRQRLEKTDHQWNAAFDSSTSRNERHLFRSEGLDAMRRCSSFSTITMAAWQTMPSRYPKCAFDLLYGHPFRFGDRKNATKSCLPKPFHSSLQKCALFCTAERTKVTEPVPPPSTRTSLPIWTETKGGVELDARRQIFCNRSLTMNSIKSVGFDMDYTLVQYKPETFEMLAFEETKKKLIMLFDYPEALNDFALDWTYMMRGLVVDKQRGNVLKADRHKYVKVAYHGFQKLSEEERQQIYGRSEVRNSLDEPEYTMIDTLFSISEAFLYMTLVELKETHPDLLKQKSFLDIYNDVRFTIDYCHRDGTLKRKVAENPEKYIYADEHLLPLLQMLRESGKSIFLATNSLWDYTNITMNYLLTQQKARNLCSTVL